MNKIFKNAGLLALAGVLALQTTNVFAVDDNNVKTCKPGQTEHNDYFMFLNVNSSSHYSDNIPEDTSSNPLTYYTAADKWNNIRDAEILYQWSIPIQNAGGSDKTGNCNSPVCSPWTIETYWQKYYDMWTNIDANPSSNSKELVYRNGNDSYIAHDAWWRSLDRNFSGQLTYHAKSDSARPYLLQFIKSNLSDLATKGTNYPVTDFHSINGLGTSVDETLRIEVERLYKKKDNKAGVMINGENKVYSPGVYAVRYCTGTPTEDPEPDKPTDQKKYTLRYDGNGDNVDESTVPNPVTFTENNCVDISKSEPKREGYTFVGWYLSKNGSGQAYGKNGNSQYCENADATLYAQWKENDPDKKTIKYDKNTTDVVGDIPNDVTFTDKCVDTVSDNWPTREGWRFITWNTEKNGSGKSFRPGSKLDKDLQCKDLTLYAIWEEVTYNADGTYTVTYDANGGKNAPATQTEKNGACTKVSDAKPTLSKSKFLGWSRDPKATEADSKYAAGADYCGDEGNITLYAVWAPQTGVSAHLIAFGAAAIAAGAALIVAKKKDLFKQI